MGALGAGKKFRGLGLGLKEELSEFKGFGVLCSP